MAIAIEHQARLIVKELREKYSIEISNEIIDTNRLLYSVEDDVITVALAYTDDTSFGYELFEFIPEVSNNLLSMAYFESGYLTIFYDKEGNEVESHEITINVRKERMKNLLNEL